MAEPTPVEARTYSLTPEQFTQFMDGMPDLASFVHLDARIGPDGSYSTGSLVRGTSQEDRERLGLSGRPQDGVGSLRRYFDRSGAATRYTIRTDDPAIQARLQEMGIAGATDEERMRPTMEAMRRIIDGLHRARETGRPAPGSDRLAAPYDEHSRRFEMRMDEMMARALAVATATAPTYTLTPEQFQQLMRRDDMQGLVSYDDAMVHIGPNGNYSRVYIQPDGPLGVGAVATAESRFNAFTGRTESIVISTTDPRVLGALRDMGIQPRVEQPRIMMPREPAASQQATPPRQGGRQQ